LLVLQFAEAGECLFIKCARPFEVPLFPGQIRLMAADYPKLAAQLEALSEGYLNEWVRRQASVPAGKR